MSIVVLWICVLIATGQVSAWEYCSKTKDPVSCVLCEGDSVPHGYKCPRQCGAERSVDLCDSVCSDHCVRSECEYDVTGSLRCLHGCKPGHHGNACEQKCKNCKGDVCDVTGTCVNGCKSGYYGKTCDTLCDKCKSCDKSGVDCDVCDTTKGTCLLGCVDGYYGAKCDKTCQSRCVRCHPETGECQQCTTGWYGNKCQQECQNCRNKKCNFDNGQCLDGCASGYHMQGTTCHKVVAAVEEKKDPEKKKAIDGLAAIFGEEDYLLPLIGCLLVLFAVIAVVIFCRCRKGKPKDEEKDEKPDVEEGKCNGLSSHPSLRRSSVDSTPHLYQELVEEAIRTHSCEEILKKHNMLDPDRPRLSPLGDKSLASLRNRTGNLSMPFMTPIEEDEEEEIEDDGVHIPNVGIIFTLESPSDDDECANEPDTSRLHVSHEDVSSSMESVEPKTVVTGTPTDPSSDPTRDIYILQRGSLSAPQSPGGRAISFDHLDTTHSSGRSTPMVPDMYLENPHEERNQFSTMLSDHLDTYLTDRSNPETAESPVENGVEVDVSESDALLGRVRFQINNNQVLKSRNPAPTKLKVGSASRGHAVTNGDMGLDRGHVSLSSEREPMLSHTYDSSA